MALTSCFYQGGCHPPLPASAKSFLSRITACGKTRKQTLSVALWDFRSSLHAPLLS